MPPDEELQDIRRLFETFLHQDWTIHGETLEEVLANNYGMDGTTEGIRIGALSLLKSDLTELQFEQLASGSWGAGYEPEAEGFEDWRSALREIIRICDTYPTVEK